MQRWRTKENIKRFHVREEVKPRRENTFKIPPGADFSEGSSQDAVCALSREHYLEETHFVASSRGNPEQSRQQQTSAGESRAKRKSDSRLVYSVKARAALGATDARKEGTRGGTVEVLAVAKGRARAALETLDAKVEGAKDGTAEALAAARIKARAGVEGTAEALAAATGKARAALTHRRVSGLKDHKLTADAAEPREEGLDLASPSVSREPQKPEMPPPSTQYMQRFRARSEQPRHAPRSGDHIFRTASRARADMLRTAHRASLLRATPRPWAHTMHGTHATADGALHGGPSAASEMLSRPHALPRRRRGRLPLGSRVLRGGKTTAILEETEERPSLTAEAIVALEAGWALEAPFGGVRELETCSEPSTANGWTLSSDITEERPHRMHADEHRAPTRTQGATASDACGETELEDGIRADELLLAQRLFNDYGKPPSDHPGATLISKGTALPRVWRYKPPEGRLDVYVSDIELPVRVESFLQMTCATTSRSDWDETAKDFKVLSSWGPSELQALHGERADFMYIYWLMSTPFPLATREYFIERKLSYLRPFTADGPRAYLKIDRMMEDSRPELQVPTAKRAVRVTDYSQYQLVWPGEADGTTVVRTVYVENPMITIPSWLQSWITDKALPKGLRAMSKAAVEFERKQGRGAKNGKKAN